MRSRETIYGLDIIRFFAAAIVLAWHLGYRFFDPAAPFIRKFVAGVPTDLTRLDGLPRYGWVGVEIFFVISGLVIAYSALRSSPWRFFIGRLGRLLPGVLAVCALTLLINCLYWDFPPARQAVLLIKTVLFLPRPPWLMPQFWTLPVEILFYTLVWLVIAVRRAERLDSLALLLLVASCIYWTAVTTGLHQPRIGIDRLLLVQHAFYFAMGIALCSIDRLGVTFVRVAILIVGTMLAVVEINFAATKYGVARGDTPWLVPFAIWLVSVVGIAASLRYKSSISTLVRARPWLAAASQNLGLATYPLYLCHIHVGGWFTTLAVASGMEPAPAILLAALGCVLVAIGIAKRVEPPVRKALVAMLENLRSRIIGVTGQHRVP